MKSKHNLLKLFGAGIFFVAIILFSLIFAAGREARALSLYTPFGGKIEEYKQKSDAECVEDTCGEINDEVQSTIRELIAAPTATLCASISTPCASVYGIGYAVCFAACEAAINGAVEAISVCDAEEIKIGPPKEAKVGILGLGTINISVGGLDIAKIKLSSLLPNLSVITPEIYDYKNYKEEGVWALGDALNVLNFCKLGEVGGDGTSEICNNFIVKIFLEKLAGGQEAAGDEAYNDAINSGATEEEAKQAESDKEESYAKDCPLLNLLHQVGTSPKLTTLEGSGSAEALQKFAPPTMTPSVISTLRLGTKNSDVGILQNKLQKLDLYTGNIDNIFGPKTLFAVQIFQLQNNLVPDGIVGPKTRAVINSI